MTTIDFTNYSAKEDDRINEIISKIESGEQVYVKIASGSRAGTVGRVKKILNKAASTSYYYRKYDVQFQIVFDDRKNKISPRLNTLIWLKNYTGPTIWHFNKVVPEVVKKPTKDKFGNELSEGNTVLFAYNQYNRKGPSVLIGNISKISKTGTIYCNPFLFSSTDYDHGRIRITTNSSLIKVDEHLQDRILLAKLSQ